MAELTIRQYKTPIMKRISGVLLLAIGIVFLAATLYYASKDFPLWIFGRQTKAEVVELWVEQVNQLEERQDGELQFSYNLKYQFTTPNGRVIIKNTTASATEWSGMSEGTEVDILYFPLYPGLNRLDDTRWAFFLSCTYIPLIIISFIGLRVGWYMLTSP